MKNSAILIKLPDGEFFRGYNAADDGSAFSRISYNPETATDEEHRAFYNYMWSNFKNHKYPKMRSIIWREVQIILSNYKSRKVLYSRTDILVDTVQKIEMKYPSYDPMWIEFYILKYMAFLTGSPKWMPYKDITGFYIEAFNLFDYVMRQRSRQNIMRGTPSEEKSRKKYLEAILEYLTMKKQFLASNISE